MNYLGGLDLTSAIKSRAAFLAGREMQCEKCLTCAELRRAECNLGVKGKAASASHEFLEFSEWKLLSLPSV